MRLLLHPFLWVAYALVVALAVLVAVGQSREAARGNLSPATAAGIPSQPPATASPVLPKPSASRAAPLPEVLLATIQHGEQLPESDARVRAFAVLLDTMESRCSEDRLRLADLITDANEALEHAGQREPILDTFRDFVSTTDGVANDFPCEVLFTDYVEGRLRGAQAQ